VFPRPPVPLPVSGDPRMRRVPAEPGISGTGRAHTSIAGGHPRSYPHGTPGRHPAGDVGARRPDVEDLRGCCGFHSHPCGPKWAITPPWPAPGGGSPYPGRPTRTLGGVCRIYRGRLGGAARGRV